MAERFLDVSMNVDSMMLNVRLIEFMLFNETEGLNRVLHSWNKVFVMAYCRSYNSHGRMLDAGCSFILCLSWWVAPSREVGIMLVTWDCFFLRWACWDVRC